MPEMIVLVFLIWCSVRDVRYQVISVRMLFAGISVSMGYLIVKLIRGELELGQAGICLMPGILLIVISILAKGAVGMGDGAVWLVIGGALSPWDGVSALLLGMLFIAVWSGGLMLTGRAGRRTRLPFLPFSLAGYVLWILIKPFW